MRRVSALRLGVPLLCCAALVGCVDSPSAPESAADDNQLAASFDGLAQEQLTDGDVERSEDFRWAALAVRAGVTPTRPARSRGPPTARPARTSRTCAIRSRGFSIPRRNREQDLGSTRGAAGGRRRPLARSRPRPPVVPTGTRARSRATDN